MTATDCLKWACDKAIADPKLQPVKLPNGEVETHCNFGVEAILGDPVWGGSVYDKFNGKTADLIHAAISNGGELEADWKAVTLVDASRLANKGCRVIAILSSAQLQQGHGHVAVCYPAPPVMSAKRGHLEPMLANIGLEDKEEGANFAFHIDPEFHALRDDIQANDPVLGGEASA